MRRMLNRLFGRHRREELFDVAQGDWAPVPAGEAASTDWVQWLEEPRPVPRAAESAAAASPPARPAPQPRVRVATLPGERRWRDVLCAFAEHLTEEELRIIRGQMAS